MPVLFGATRQEEIDHSCILFSITVTPTVGADGVVKVYRYTDENADPLMTIRASGNSTNEITFPSGVPMTGGLTAVPTNVESFIIGYA